MFDKIRKLMYPKKMVTCHHCNTRFQFPIKPGKVLDVRCPKCKSVYRVSFVNPLSSLIKGTLKWKDVGIGERYKIMALVISLIIAIGLISSSIMHPIKPRMNQQQVMDH